MLPTVPLDRTGVQPRPRQAKAIVSSCPLSLFYFFSFYAAPTFFLSLLVICCSVMPPHLLLHTLLKHSCTSPTSRLTASVDIDPPPPHPPAVPALSSFSWPYTSLTNKYFFLGAQAIWTLLLFLAASHITVKKNDTPMSHCKLRFFSYPSHFSLQFTPVIWSDGRLLPGHGCHWP